jgi:ADP-heptose:LPS heptosyltransferase
MKRVLVIRLSALGDVVLSFGPFAAIRAHHAADHLTVLTTRPFAGLLAASPWFDAVETDARPRWWDMAGVLRLRRQLQGFDMVYDLQTSGRTSRYFLLAGRPRWSGIAPGAALPHANPHRDAMHTIDRQREQLEMAGITDFPPPDLGWLRGDITGFGLPARFALLVPGAAPHRPEKRWPEAAYGVLAQMLAARGIAPAVVGTRTEAPLAAAIRAAEPAAIDLTGRTRIEDLAALAARAALAIGNDTGPMHLAAAMGAPCLVLFGGASDPALTAPRGDVRVLRVDDLRTLPPDRVAASLP